MKTIHLTRRAVLATAAIATLGALAGPARAGGRAVRPRWASGGAAKALSGPEDAQQAKGHHWKDFAVAGGAGDAAMTVLKSRAISGNAPTAAQIKGPLLQDWAAEGMLANIDTVAKAERWDELLLPVISDIVKYKGHYIAVPVNVHRVNWLWINPEVMKKAGVKPPTSWDEFFIAADALKKAGVIPLAHGGQSWQDFTTFETVVLGTGGPAFYRKALIQLDPASLKSPTMEKSLATFRRLKAYTDRNAPGRDWNLATAMVMKGEAAMQIMGDWAKGEFLAAGKTAGKDFLCVPAPGTAKSYTFNVDSFAMFKVKGEANQQAQRDMASAIRSPAVQESFNLEKGSIPVRQGVSLARYDDCAKASAADFAEAGKAGTLLPSIAHGMAVRAAAEGALKDVVSQFWNSDAITPAQAMDRLVAAAKTQ